MINFKREYIGLEQDRLLYPVSFKDKAKCNVYGRKKFITEAGEVQLSAHVFLISKDFWTFNAGQLDFTNYPNGIWNDYISIDIVEKDEYTAPSINFGSMGDITPENLQGLSDYISKHLSDLEKRIVEDYLFIDEGVSENIELPNLPENHFWARRNGVIVGVNLDYLKADYEHLKNELWKNYESFNEKLQAALKKYYDDLELQMNNFFKDLIEKIREEAEKQLGLIAGAGGGLLHKIGQVNHGFIFDPIVYENGVWKKATTTSGVDGIGVVISANTFFFLEAGEIEIPKGATDKDGQPLLDDEYYYMNEDGGTGFQKEEPVWFYQPLFHTRTYKEKLLANVHIDTMEDLRGQVVDTESGRTHGIALWEDIVPKFDTIEKLQKAFWLKEGEVVEVLGYYSAGDGAGHKRIIKAEDDGSGVQLSNNLWACIVHNGIVYLDWYGDYSKGFMTAFSNTIISSIRANKSQEIKITKNISRNTKLDIDLNNCIFVFDSNNAKIKIEYKHEEEYSFFQKIEIEKNNSVKNSIFNLLPNNTFIRIVDNAPWSISPRQVDRVDINVKLFKNFLIRPFYTSYLTNDNYDIRTRKLDNYSEWKNFKISINFPKNSSELSNLGMFVITRDNFKIENLTVETTENSSFTSTYRGAMFIIDDCYNINIFNVTGNNFSGLTDTETSSAGYVFEMDDVVKMSLNNVILSGAWGAIGCNRIHQVYVNNCNLNRFDSHSYSSDWIIENSYFNLEGIYYPEFYGTLKIKDCIFDNTLICNRGDYQADHFENIHIINCEFINSFIQLITDHDSAYRGTSQMPNVLIDGINVIELKEGNLITISFNGIPNLNPSNYIEIKNVNHNLIDCGKIFIRNIKTNNLLVENCNILNFDNNGNVHFDDTNSQFQIYNLKNSFEIVGQNTIKNNVRVINSNIAFSYEDDVNTPNIFIDKCIGFFDILYTKIQKKSKISNSLIYTTLVIDKGKEIVSYDIDSTLCNFIDYSNCVFDWIKISPYENYAYKLLSLQYLRNNSYDKNYSNCVYKSTNILDTSEINSFIKLDYYFTKNKWEYLENLNIQQLNSIYHLEKMKQENVYDDYISYMDEKTVYDKQQRKLEQDKQLAYEEALKENPELTFEEFMSVQPMTLNLVEEPQPSQALQDFMEKYL